MDIDEAKFRRCHQRHGLCGGVRPWLLHDDEPRGGRDHAEVRDGDGAERGVLKPNASIMLNGVNLFKTDDAGTKVTFYEINPVTGEAAPEPTAEVTAFTSRGPNMLVFAWVDTLVSGRKYLAVPSRSADGEVWFTGAGKEASVAA